MRDPIERLRLERLLTLGAFGALLLAAAAAAWLTARLGAS